MSGRTPEEREAARLERERRRAAREGRPLPPEPPPAVEPPAAQRHDEAHATQQYDVTRDWADAQTARAGLPSWTAEQAALTPHANGTDEHAASGAEPGWADERAAPAAQPGWTGEHAVPAVAEGPEVPIGTRRVNASERLRARAGGWGRGGGPGARGRGAGGSGAPRGRLRGRVAAAAAIVLVALVGWFLVSLFQPFAGDGGARVVVRIPTGASASAIGDQLAHEGVVASGFFFRLRATLSGDRGDLKSGTFTLRRGMSYGAALEALTKNPAPPPVTRVTIPEGLSVREIVPLLRQDGVSGDYLAAARAAARGFHPRRYGAPRGASLEGFLFPATYELRRPATAAKLVDQQLTALRQSLATVSLRAARAKNLTPYDVLVIASMVEREVSVAKERPLVAAVIYNRLHDHIPLGIDATLRFALHDWTHALRVSQLQNPTPYNTRLHQGLPPGPIGNPGLASIQAAAHPAKVGYLYYVVKPGTCGELAFSSTDAQFQRDVARYNAARAAAGGKSPTKC